MDIKAAIENYEVIIFDLGGVVIDLTYEDTIDALEQLGAQDFKELYSQALQSDLFDRYETGAISSLHFINKLKEYLPASISPNKVVSAWNAMIKSFQPEKLDFLLKLKLSHKTALLSNTNDLHETFVRRKLSEQTNLPLEAYFHNTYLSHQIKQRKPHPETFLWVCEEMGVKAKDVLFIDDSAQHIEGAKKAGLNALLFPQNDVWY